MLVVMEYDCRASHSPEEPAEHGSDTQLQINDLLGDVDEQWTQPPSVGAEKIRLQMIGASALMLQTEYSRGTKDGDVLETNVIVEAVREQLIRLAGAGSLLHKRHGMYLEIVPAGLPFLPQPSCGTMSQR